ncbi:hypothetical protein B0H13DRAFT_1850639 [Mycena leptocephala]|nr:hypothetical protein B0H13DRAFT_1850639 [Mycena leptocephala]
MPEERVKDAWGRVCRQKKIQSRPKTRSYGIPEATERFMCMEHTVLSDGSATEGTYVWRKEVISELAKHPKSIASAGGAGVRVDLLLGMTRGTQMMYYNCGCYNESEQFDSLQTHQEVAQRLGDVSVVLVRSSNALILIITKRCMAGLCMDHRCAESRHGADKLIDLPMCDFGRNVQIEGSQHCLLEWIGLLMMSMHPENISDKFNADMFVVWPGNILLMIDQLRLGAFIAALEPNLLGGFLRANGAVDSMNLVKGREGSLILAGKVLRASSTTSTTLPLGDFRQQTVKPQTLSQRAFSAGYFVIRTSASFSSSGRHSNWSCLMSIFHCNANWLRLKGRESVSRNMGIWDEWGSLSTGVMLATLKITFQTSYKSTLFAVDLSA